MHDERLVKFWSKLVEKRPKNVQNGENGELLAVNILKCNKLITNDRFEKQVVEIGTR